MRHVEEPYRVLPKIKLFGSSTIITLLRDQVYDAWIEADIPDSATLLTEEGKCSVLLMDLFGDKRFDYIFPSDLEETLDFETLDTPESLSNTAFAYYLGSYLFGTLDASLNPCDSSAGRIVVELGSGLHNWVIDKVLTYNLSEKQLHAFCDWLQWVLYSPSQPANGYEYIYEEVLRIVGDVG